MIDGGGKFERLHILKRDVGRREMVKDVGADGTLTGRQKKGWAERDGKEGTESGRDGASESRGNAEGWRK